MLIDEQNRFLTLRELPQLTQFILDIDSDKITVTPKNSAGSEKLQIRNQIESAKTLNAVVWDDSVEVIEANPDISTWFSDHLKFKCRLVFFPEKNKRRVDS